jgi:hypothetical protein
MGEPTPQPTPKPAEGNPSWQDYTPTDTSTFGREDLRKLFADLGWDIPIPATLTDLEQVGSELQTTIDKLDKVQTDYGSTTGLGKLTSYPLYLAQTITQRAKAQLLAEKLYSYAGEMFGSEGQTIVSRTLRPPTPSVATLPTPEEFLGGYNEAFATHIGSMAGQLTKEEIDFANNEMKNGTYQTYLGKLGEIAKSGTSPFSLQEVSRAERGIEPGSLAGAALDKALGPGVTEPTTVTGKSDVVSEAIDTAGQGVPKEFISVPKYKPLDYLQQNLSVEAIKVAYAGSPQGAGKTARQAPAGFVANPRR